MSDLQQINVQLWNSLGSILCRFLEAIKIRSRKNLPILLGYLGLLLVFGLLPEIRAQGVSLGNTILQNSLHIPAYFGLTLVFYNFLKSDSVHSIHLLKHPVFYSALSALLCGLIIELLQGMTPSRDSSFIDVVLNFAGIIFFVIGISLYNEVRWVQKMQQGVPSLLTAYHSCYFQEFEILQDRLQILKSEDVSDHKVILVVSTNPREGKTTVMLSLGLALAQKEKRRVALVDLNQMNPQLHEILGKSGNIGALELFQGFVTAQIAVQPTILKNLDVVTIGNLENSRHHGFSSVAVRQAIMDLRRDYEVVFIELTPLSFQVKNAISIRLLAALADHILLVIQKDATERRKIRDNLKLFDGYDSKILGTVINNRLKIV